MRSLCNRRVSNSERKRRFLVGMIISTRISKGGCRGVDVLSSEWGAIQDSFENYNWALMPCKTGESSISLWLYRILQLTLRLYVYLRAGLRTALKMTIGLLFCFVCLLVMWLLSINVSAKLYAFSFRMEEYIFFPLSVFIFCLDDWGADSLWNVWI
jgi:sensor histidine kinase YesM